MHMPSTSLSNNRKAKIILAFAFAFASGINSHYEPGIAGEILDTARRSIKPSDSNSPEPLTSAQKSEQADYRAYRLLMRADAYLAGQDRAQVEANFPIASPTAWGFNSGSHELLSQWAKRVSKEEFKSNKNASIAIGTINEAVSELSACKDSYTKLHMYLVASVLLRKAGDEKDSKKCEEYIENFIHHCETAESLDEKQMSVAISLLNSKAYGLVAVDIPDTMPSYSTSPEKVALPDGPPTFQELADSEALWLRSAVLADRLKPTAHLRRMVHRNLSLWYQMVGKKDQAEQQKQILFSLVGKHDDRLLYPSKGFCGGSAWWILPSARGIEMCGMG
jgi:hypothetical protein